MLGILLIDKPLGITSHDVVAQLRRKFKTKRVGHAGTLDPLATGLLVVAVGSATRFLQYLPLEPKEYVGEICFGRETNTQDAEGEVTADLPVPSNFFDLLHVAAPQFRGLIQQVPPMFSAVKQAGKPLYVLARQGIEVVREPRSVHISELEFAEELEANGNLPFRVVCSGGTYVRTLSHDLGRVIGCGAHLAGLQRTRVGRFEIEAAMPLDEVTEEDLFPLADALPPMTLVQLNLVQSQSIRQGQAIGWMRPPASPTVGLLDEQGLVIGIAKYLDNQLQPECVIPVEAQNGFS